LQLASARSDQAPDALTEILTPLLTDLQVDPAVLRLALRLKLPAALPKALALIADSRAPEADRIGMLQAIGATRHAECVGPLLGLLTRQESPAIQSAALSALQPQDDPAIAEKLLEQYARMSPELKTRVRALLVSRVGWSRALVDAVREGRVPPAEVSLEQVRQMVVHNDSALTANIESLWGKVAPATTREKQGRINAISQILAKGKGDAANGKPLMIKYCGICHQLFGEGNKIGPDLTGVDRKNLSILLANVVDPTAVIRPEFVAYTAETADGRVLNGLLASSTPESITLLDNQNMRTILARDEIESLEPMSISLMPERILDPLSDQELRDLFAYLQSDQQR
jgi:putative heme-binding domain-containing protein